MFALERQKRIMELLRENGSVMVNDLSRDFGVTLETVRRDLEKLEQMEQVKRTHGGAVLFEETAALDLSLEKRSGLNIDGKIAIAKKAVKLIRTGDTVFLDSSTTSFYLSKALKELKNITVITNNLLIVNELQACDKIKIISTGGTLDMRNLSFVGEIALRNIEENFFANKVFFSCKGVIPEKGMLESNDVEYQIKSAMIRNSRQKICIVDESKLNTVAFIKLAEFSDIDYFITDKTPDEKYKKVLKQNKVELK